MLLKPANFNLTTSNGLAVYKNADWSMSFQILDDEEPMDLTGMTGYGSIRESANDTDALAVFTVTVSDPTNGMVSVSLSAEQTADIPSEGDYCRDTDLCFYDIYISDGTDASRVLNGSVQISPNIFRDSDFDDEEEAD